MTLIEIIEKLNEKINNSTILCNFQKVRREIKDKKRGSNLFFSYNKLHEDYAFHYGGRNEIQFNVGDDENVFRYGLAFSLESSIDLPDPISELKPKIKKFNEYIQKNQEEYKNLFMWRWNSGVREDTIELKLIPDNWIEKQSFIFIGYFFNKKSSEINDNDIEIIVERFEELYPIYEFVELRQKKLAKICWNDNMWVNPSGLIGKSMDTKSYERKYGFGHEEWLFDFNKIINNYHYSSLQPIGKYIDKYENKSYDIRLYTYNSKLHKWYWVAEIDNVITLSKEEAKNISISYRKNGWIDMMVEELKQVDANYSEIESFNEYMFNIKFKPSEVHFFIEGGMIEFDDKEKINHYRYTLLNIDNLPSLPSEDEKVEIQKDDKNINKSRLIHMIKKHYADSYVEFEFLHSAIQDDFYLFLKKTFPLDKIVKEAFISGINRRIDIYHKREDGTQIIYEVKSYNNLETSIKDAIGQLLEYAYYPDRKTRFQLFVVSHKQITIKLKQYINNLNNLLGINLGVIFFDNARQTIVDSLNFDIKNYV